MRLASCLSVSLLLVRWAILGALLSSEPETADTIAGILFGPARRANDFPRLFLPAIDRGVLRFLGGELLWLAVSAAAAFVARSVWSRRRASPLPPPSS